MSLAGIPLVLPLHEIREADEPWVGGKARGLARLLRAGFPVPPGFVLTAAAYEAARREGGGLDERLPAELRQGVEEAFFALRSVGEPQGLQSMIVRSSASDEDSAERSFAGIYESYAGVATLEHLWLRIRQCWDSLEGERAKAYRGNGAGGSRYMAVIVQVEIPAEWSGVLYTVDPSGRRERLCVEVVRGSPSQVVEGSARTTVLYLSREDPTRILASSGAVPAELPLAQVSDLARMALEVEHRLGGPQDLEWVLWRSQWFLVQARLARLASRTAARPESEEYRRGLDEPFSPFAQWLEGEKSRHYQRALLWIKGPGYRRDVRFVEGRLYVRTRARLWTRLWEWLSGGIAMFLTPWAIRCYRRRQRWFLRHMLELERDVESVGSAQVLYERLQAAVDCYLEFAGRTSVMAGHLANLHAAVLRRVCAAIGDECVPLAESLLLGLPSVVQQRDAALWSLARRGSSEKERREFAARYGYIWAEGNPKDPAWRVSPVAKEQMLRALANAPESANPALRWRRQQERCAEAERTVLRRLETRPSWQRLWLGLVFGFALRRARQLFPIREERNHLFYTGVLVIRRILLRCGAVLAAEGRLRDPEEVFQYDLEQLGQLVQGRDPGKPSAPAEVRAEPSGEPTVWQRPASSILHGTAASPGRVRGRARVLRDSSGIPELRPGEILVCPAIRPYLTPVLLLASALVTDRGGVLSHGANLAREYGIPAVTGAGDATSAIPDGAYIEVDGDRGEVYILERDLQ